MYDTSSGRRYDTDTDTASANMNRSAQSYIDKTTDNSDAVVEMVEQREKKLKRGSSAYDA